jgi:hypothetical protein
MTVIDLIEQLQRLEPDAEVRAMDVYGEPDLEGEGFPITGMVFDNQNVMLTNETTN